LTVTSLGKDGKDVKTEHKLTYDLAVLTPAVTLWIKEGRDVTVTPKNEAVKI
jgi:hypothetical protein